MREYIDQGARLGWLIDPETATVEIYRPGRPVEILNGRRRSPARTCCPGSCST